MKNFGPRLGAAYQLDDKTVVRASYGIMFTHGNDMRSKSCTSNLLAHAEPELCRIRTHQRQSLGTGGNSSDGRIGILHRLDGPPAYMFANSPRTAPFHLYGPGNYSVHIGLARTFDLGFEGAKFDFRAELYNITNHTQFSVANVQWATRHSVQ